MAGKKGNKFPGFWAEFEGEKVASYEDPRIDKNICYTLYRCTACTSNDRYRVHVVDESNPANPVYVLLPNENPYGTTSENAYHEPYYEEHVEEKYLMFLKDIDYFRSRNVEPPRRI